MASFIADHSEIHNGRPAGQAVDLRGTSTNWGQATTFSLSGVANTSVATKIVNSATSARLVIATGAGTGTLTITDGGTGGTGATATLKVAAYRKPRWFAGLSRR